MIVIDAQLPPALAMWFQERGFTAEHVGPLMGDPAASDECIWTRARQPGWMIVSKDQDFVDRGTLYGPPPIVIHVNLGNCSNRNLLAHLDRCWSTVVALVQQPDAAVVTIDWLAIGLRTTNQR